MQRFEAALECRKTYYYESDAGKDRGRQITLKPCSLHHQGPRSEKKAREQRINIESVQLHLAGITCIELKISLYKL